MKRSFSLIISFAVAVLLFVACSSDDNLPVDKTEVGKIDKSKYTTLTTVNDGMTRSHYIINHTLNNGADVWWQPGDKLWLYILDNLRIGSVTSNLTAVSSTAEFYFTYDFDQPQYKVNYLGNQNSADGYFVTFGEYQWQYPPNNTDHLQYNGDCAEGTATRIVQGQYTVRMHRLPAYLCIMPYCSDPDLRTGAILKSVTITADNALRGKFDVGRYGLFDRTHAQGLGNNINMVLNGGNGFSVDNATMDQAKNAVYVVMLPGWHNLTIEFYYTSPKFPGQTLCARKNIGNREYKANSMTDIVADIANYYDADHQHINAGDNIATAKRYVGLQIIENKDWK
ncbi:hypothetical protein [Segatella oulorum]|uniref:hypothetical protein n=1 Tax=Segatella oulorum TaxID=28136 RepID=UPI0028EBFCC9|nr:hypothetical protein [Segatella oulorum]